MAKIVVKNTIGRIVKFVAPMRKRAQASPVAYELEATGKIANAFHAGGTTVVRNKSQQAAIHHATDVWLPIGTRLVNVPRPMKVDRQAVRILATRNARFIVTGKKVKGKEVLVAGVMRSLDAGGPGWKKSRNFKKWKARRPTGGGRRGRLGRAWRQGGYSEK